MIIVYSTKAFDKLVKSKSKTKIQRQMEELDSRLTAKAIRNVNVRERMRIKAKRQPRRKDGRFAKPLPNLTTVAKTNPLVAFDYPRSDAPWIIKPRIVRLISTTATHITGLEQVGQGWKYKKFLKPKAKSFQILSFNPQAMA